MMHSEPPLSRDVVLIGGGHTHALVLRRWGMSPIAGARLTVINPEPTAPYTGMLPGFVAGHYGRDELDIDLVRLARFAGARLIFGRATGIDLNARRVAVSGRPDVAFDIASIDIGITSAMADLPGFAEHAVAAKPLGPFASAWETFRNGATGPVAVIGGGVGGVELALAMRHRLGPEPEVTVIEAGYALSGVSHRTRRALLREMREASIELLEGVTPERVTAEAVHLMGGREVPSAFIVGAAGARPFVWLESTGLALEDGYIAVDATLRSVTDPAVYAVGDCAHLTHAPRPKAGVFAVRAAPVLAHNIAADLTGGARKRFDPQKRYLKLISLGRKAAVVDKYGLAPKGGWAWTWKDRIDRKFMDRLNAWPDMSARAAAPRVAKASRTDDHLCGGCGAKVGGDVLDEALARLDIVARDDVVAGAGDDAAVLASAGVEQVITTDHLPAFWPDPYVMTRIAAVHALGDVLAMGAAPQAMLAQITLPRMTDDLQVPTLDECLRAANEVAREAGAALVGGHTTMGAELTIGFAVTGLLDGPARTLEGAQPGDALVLTRPIGSGTILAAEMRGAARGEHVAACLDTMSRLDMEDAAALRRVATAMTDITGFGLAGHAARMADASGATLEIELDKLPLYAGAEALADAGIRSTIYPANRRAVPMDIPDHGRAALLFDPQTAGGLFAAVPHDAAAGLDLTVVGRVLPRGPRPIVVT